MSGNQDILLTADYHLNIESGDFAIANSEMQEVGLILSMNQGEMKSDPLLGVGLIQMLKSRANQLEIEKRVKMQLQRDGKDYNQIKEQINIKGIVQ